MAEQVLDLATPVLAVEAYAGRLWVGGVGGVAWLRSDGTGEVCTGAELRSYAALCPAGSWLVAGGAEGIVRVRDGIVEPADLAGSGAPVAALAVLPADEGESPILLAGTLGDGVLRSEDGGRNWATANFGLPDYDVSALVVSPGGTVLAGTGSGVAVATPGAKAWRPCRGTQGTAIAALAFIQATEEVGSRADVPTPRELVVAASENGKILASYEQGGAWEPRGSVDAPVTALLAVPDSPGVVVAGTAGGGVFRSFDAGATWVPATDPTCVRTVFSLAAHDGSLYAGTTDGLARSDDGGGTWRLVRTPPTHDVNRILTWKRRIVVVGARSGPAVVVDRDAGPAGAPGTTVEQLAEGAPFPLSALEVAGETLLASGPGGLFRLPETGTPSTTTRTQAGEAAAETAWERVVSGEDGHVGVINIRTDGVGLAAPARHGNVLLRTKDGGASWEQVPAPFGMLPVTALAVTEHGCVAAVRDGRHNTVELWFSPDGADWRREATAETVWPVVGAFDAAGQPAVSLGRTVHRRDETGRWCRWLEFDTGIRAICGHSHGFVVVTQRSFWAVSPDGAERDELADGKLEEGQDVLDIVVDPTAAPHDRCLYVLLTHGRIHRLDLPTSPTPRQEKGRSR